MLHPKQYFTLAAAPTLLLLILVICVTLLNWRPSAIPEIYIFSFTRFIGLAVMVGLIGYLSLSVLFEPLKKFNNVILFSVAAGSMALEIILRSYTSLIPDTFLYLLPFDDGQRIANQRGLLTHQNTVGEGILFSWKPGITIPDKPWVKIDSNGFYNSHVPDKKTDVVFIGASIIATTTAQRNFARTFADKGLAAYTVAIGGPFGPYQYLEAYKKYIIDRKIDHKYVAILLAFPLDVNKAFQTHQVIKKGGDYRDLYSNSAVQGIIDDRYVPWTVSIFTKLPSFILSRNAASSGNRDRTKIKVNFKYGAWDVPTRDFAHPDESNGWPYLESTLSELIGIAHEHGVKPVILHYPLTPVTILPYVKAPKSLTADLATYHKETVNKIRSFSEKNKALFFDMTPNMRQAVNRELIFVKPMEFHLNQRGVDLATEFLLPLFTK
jgi:hypothetical protein